MCVVACIVPLWIEPAPVLAGIAIGYVLYALSLGLRFRVLGGWVIFGLLSYAWHRDLARVLDMHRTLVLRFLPLAMASMVLVATVRPIDLVRLLRRMRFSPVILLPLASVVRGIPRARREMRQSIDALRAQGHWNGPLS
jgi:hypothetical protein